MVAPSQYGPPLVGVGVAGVALTTTFVVPAAEVQPLTVMVTEYVPASAVVALERVGFCCEEVKPLGPVHEYVALAKVGMESEIVAPSQYRPVLQAVRVGGGGWTTSRGVLAGRAQATTS